MSNDNLIQFTTQIFPLSQIPESYEPFIVTCTKYLYENGDLNDYERQFLVLAPDHTHAQTWAQVHFLACGQSFNTHNELLDHLNENLVSDDEPNYFTLMGAQDVGDLQYRIIDSLSALSPSDLEVLLRHSSFDGGNYTL